MPRTDARTGFGCDSRIGPDPDEDLLRYPPFIKGLPASDVDALLAKQAELIRRLQDGVGMTDADYRDLVRPVVRRLDPWARDPTR